MNFLSGTKEKKLLLKDSICWYSLADDGLSHVADVFPKSLNSWKSFTKHVVCISMRRIVTTIVMEYFLKLENLFEFIDEAESLVYIKSIFFFLMISPIHHFSQKDCIGELNLRLKVTCIIVVIFNLLAPFYQSLLVSFDDMG